MNDLIRLIHRYGGTVQFRSTTGDLGPCSEHPEYPVPPAVAEITALDTPELLPCTDCLPGAIEQAMTTAEEAGECNPAITVTVSRPARPAGRAEAA